MTTSAFSEARVRTAQAQASSGKLSERHSTRVPVASKPRDCASPTIRLCRKATVYRFEARLDLEARKAYVARNRLSLLQAAGLRTRWFVFGASGSRRTIATKIASRLVLEGADFDRHDTGDLLPEPGHPHDREASCLGRVLRDYAGSQEPWIRSPPES